MANYSETKLRKMILTAMQDGSNSLREIVARYGLCDKNYIG